MLDVREWTGKPFWCLGVKSGFTRQLKQLHGNRQVTEDHRDIRRQRRLIEHSFHVLCEGGQVCDQPGLANSGITFFA